MSDMFGCSNSNVYNVSFAQDTKKNIFSKAGSCVLLIDLGSVCETKSRKKYTVLGDKRSISGSS